MTAPDTKGGPRRAIWGLVNDGYALVAKTANVFGLNWAAGTEVGRPMNQSRYVIRVTGRAMGVGSASAFCTTRCHTWR